MANFQLWLDEVRLTTSIRMAPEDPRAVAYTESVNVFATNV
jgi:hypothetical protein